MRHTAVRPDRVLLEHHSQASFLGWDAASAVGDDLIAEAHGAGGWVEESGNGTQQGGLARSRGADQRDELAVAYIQVDAGQPGGAVGIVQVDPGEGDR